MPTAQEAYNAYVAIKLHFTSDYDYFKYNGKVRSSNVAARKDRWLFHKLGRIVAYDEELVPYIAVNMAMSKRNYVADLLSNEAMERYKDHKRFVESFSYRFAEQINILDSKYNFDVLRSKDGFFPPLLKMTLTGDIRLETFIILNDILNFFPLFDRTIKDEVVWPKTKKICLKLKPFLQLDRERAKALLKQKVLEWQHKHK